MNTAIPPKKPMRLKRTRDRRRRIPVAAIMAICFGTLVFLSVGGVLALTVGANYRNTIDLLGARSTLLISAMEDALNAQMSRAEDAVDGIATLYARGDFEIDDMGRMNAVLSGTLAGLPGASGMLIYTPDNVVRGVARGDDPATKTFVTISPKPESEPNILAAMEERRRIDGRQWGTFVTNQSIVYANVSIPLMRDGVLRGWAIAPIELTSLSTIARDLSIRFDTHAFILDGTDSVLADRRLVEQSHADKPVKPLSPLAELGDPILSQFPMRKELERFEGTTAGSVEVSSVSPEGASNDGYFGGNEYIVLTKTIAGYGRRPWTLGAYYDQAQVGDELYRVWASEVMGVGALIIAVIIAVLLGKWLARPVKSIADQALRVAAFDIEEIKPLPRSRVLELDDQAAAFNAMTTGLRAFSTYIPRSLVAKLVRTGDADITRPREAVVTVMFTDIAGFTTLSEQMEAGAAASLLNHHFDILCHAISTHGGTVDKFLGDGMMAFFGAPDRLKGHGAAAVRAAAAIREAMAADNLLAGQEGRAPLKVRIGVHSGDVIVGNIGAADRVNYTIVGDTVNISRRLEELGKTVSPDEETAIVISGETAERLDARFELTCVGEYRLRGRDEATNVFVVGAVEETPELAIRHDDAA